MENQNENKFSGWLKSSTTVKMVVIGVLILILLIPLSFVQSLIEERAGRQQEVINEINEKWGEDFLLSGPVIQIPYNKTVTKNVIDEKNNASKLVKSTEKKYLYVLPEEFDA